MRICSKYMWKRNNNNDDDDKRELALLLGTQFLSQPFSQGE